MWARITRRSVHDSALGSASDPADGDHGRGGGRLPEGGRMRPSRSARRWARRCPASTSPSSGGVDDGAASVPPRARRAEGIAVAARDGRRDSVRLRGDLLGADVLGVLGDRRAHQGFRRVHDRRRDAGGQRHADVQSTACTVLTAGDAVTRTADFTLTGLYGGTLEVTSPGGGQTLTKTADGFQYTRRRHGTRRDDGRAGARCSTSRRARPRRSS